MAVQFEDVTGGSIAVTNAVTASDPVGANAIADTSDQIWRWDTESAAWVKYFYRVQRGTVYGWCKSGGTTPTTDTIPAGETFFFRRGTGASSASLTLAGAVKEFTGTSQYTASSGQLVFMANPWPMTIAIANFASYQGSPVGANAIADTADQIWRWDTANAAWIKYFYRVQRGTVYGWCKSGETSATEDVVPVGEGFFFRRGTGSALDTITLPAPTAE